MEHAEASGLDAREAYRLLLVMMGDEKRSQYGEMSKLVHQLSKTLLWQARHEHQLNAVDVTALTEFTTWTAGREDDRAMIILRRLSQLGFTVPEATDTVMNILGTNHEVLDHASWISAALVATQARPDVLRDVYACMLGDGTDYYRVMKNFTILRELLLRAPWLHTDAGILLEGIRDRLVAGEPIYDVGVGLVEELSLTSASEDSRSPEDRRVEHFRELPESWELTPAFQPYRSARELSRGVQDLRDVAADHTNYQEGFWLYDPESGEWYSFGGETNVELERSAAAHRAAPYSVEELSDMPYMFHCHPKLLETAIGPNWKDWQHSRIALEALRGFTSATPSGHDYHMIANILERSSAPQVVRSFIAHPHGLMEYTFPNDPGLLREMAAQSRNLRKEVILGTRWDRIFAEPLHQGLRGTLDRRTRTRGKEEVVAELVGRLNDRLPEGFRLILQPDIV